MKYKYVVSLLSFLKGNTAIDFSSSEISALMVLLFRKLKPISATIMKTLTNVAIFQPLDTGRVDCSVCLTALTGLYLSNRL